MTAAAHPRAPAAPVPVSQTGSGRPRRPRDFRPSDAAELVGSAASALAVTWLLFYRFTHLRGSFGFVVVAYAAFLGVYWLVSRDAHGRVAANDRVATVAMCTGALAAFAPLVAVVGYVVARGLPHVSISLFTETLQFTGPLDPSTAGGALHAIVGTLEQVGLATALAVPLGILTAVYLNEVGGRLARPVRIIAEAMTALPSIVAGLFIYALWILRFGGGFSGGAAAAALAILMLPTVVITAEQMLRVVPGGLREAALALGAPQWRSVVFVVLPAARAGLVTGAILAVARAVGETAPMLLTAFGSKVLNPNPLEGSQDDLPLFVYSQVRSAQDTLVDRAWAGALVLLALVLVLFLLARLAARSRTARALG